MNEKQQALAAEVRAEMGRQNIKAAPIQRALNISSTAWGTYFVQCTRDVPISVVVAVAEFLGLTASELLRRAEATAATYPPADELEDGLSSSSRRALKKGRETIRDVADPPKRTRGRTRRSA